MLRSLPHSALAQQPVSRQPGEHEQQCGPPVKRGQQDGCADTDHEVDQPAGDEVHRDLERRAHHAEIEVTSHREIGGQLGTFEVSDSGRCHTDRDEPVVEMGCHSRTEVRRDHLMQRLRDQQQCKRHTHHHQWTDQRDVAGDRTDQPPERDGGDRRKHAAQHDQYPPTDRVDRRGTSQGAEELPLLPTSQPIGHLRHQDILTLRSARIFIVTQLIAPACQIPPCLSSPLNGGLCRTRGS